MALQPGPKQVHDIPLFGNRAIYALTADGTLKFGLSGTGANRTDVYFYGNTASDYLFLDASKNEITLAGAMHINNEAAVTFFDDFIGERTAANLESCGYTTVVAAGGSIATVAAVNGTVVLTNDTTDDDTQQLSHELNWQAENVIVFEARVKVDDITNVGMFVGMTDALNETTPNLPVGRSAATVTSTATDCVGFVFDTDSTTDKWFGIGVKTDVDTAQIGDTIAPVNDTYQRLRIEITAAGVASFFINGTAYGAATAAAVAPAVSLTPYIGLANRSGTAHAMTVDYIYVSSKRE